VARSSFLGVEVRPGELPRAGVLFGHLLLVIATLVVLKSVSSALFLRRVDPQALPYLYVASAVVVGVVVSVSAHWIDRVARRTLIVGTCGAFAAIFSLFWVALPGTAADMPDAPGRTLYPALYLTTDVFGTLMTTQFWTFAGDLLTGRQGRRLFGLVGAGGVAGSILGGGAVSFLAGPLGSEALLLVAAALVACIPPLAWVATRGGAAPARPHRRDRGAGIVRASLAYLRGQRYPWLLAGMALATVAATTFIDFQFKVLAEEASLTDTGLTRFFGQYNLVAGVLSLVLQVGLTSFVLSRFGVFAAVTLTPVMLMAGSAALLLAPGLLAVFVLKLLDSALAHTVDISGKQLLYVPLPERISGTMLSFIDGVVSRVGLGVAGLLLVPLALVLEPEDLAWVTLGLLAVWLALALRIRTEYRRALEASLSEFGFRPGLDREGRLDRTTRRELERALRSEDESRVLVALDFVEQTQFDLTPHLRALLHLPSSDVHVRALRHVAETGGPAAVEAILETLGEMPSEVTAEAVAAIGRLAPQQATALIRRFLEHRDPRLRRAAIGAVLADGRWDAADLEALDRFEELLAGGCGDPDLSRIEAARALADPRLGAYRHVLLHFLFDGSPEVQRAAIASAGRLAAPEYLPILLQRSVRRETREDAVRALAAYGESAIPVLDEVYETAEGWPRLRKSVIRALSEIGTTWSADVLLRKVKFASSSERYDLIKALNKIRARRPDLGLNVELVADALEREIEDYYRNCHYLVRLGADGDHLLHDALRDRLVFATERISRLLALVLPPELVFSIYRGVYGRNLRQASNAHELLDSLIERADLKRAILPLFDRLPPDETLAAVEGRFAFVSRSVEDVLEEIVTHSARWLRLCALYYAGDRGIRALRPLLQNREHEDADEEIRRTARLALRLLDGDPAARAGDGPMQTLVEKALFLKGVQLFAGLTGEDLTELAGYLKETSFEEGETIFREGERGDALFVIRSGEVELLRVGTPVETRGAAASLGELSAVDQGPRTFTAVARTPVEALEIGELELEEILQENAKISRQMLCVLAGRVRRYIQLELTGLAGETAAPATAP
jgi:ATP/ADP translocase/HEAT repeat protein